MRTDQAVDSSSISDASTDIAQPPEALLQFRKSLSDSISNNLVSTGGSLGSSRNGSSVSSVDVGGKSAHPVVVLADDAVDTSLPRVINLNQDPLFSECLVYYLPEGSVVTGSKGAQSDILLSGPDIIDRHCVLHQENGSVWLLPFAGSLVFVNGDLVPTAGQAEISLFIAASDKSSQRLGRLLRHFDRIAFGRFHLFRFEASGRASVQASPGRNRNVGGNPTKLAKLPADGSAPGWEFAQEELLRKNDSIMSLRASSDKLSVLHNHEVYSSPGQRPFQSVSASNSKHVASPKNGFNNVDASSTGSLTLPKQSSSPLHQRLTNNYGSFRQNEQRTVIPSQPYVAASAAAVMMSADGSDTKAVIESTPGLNAGIGHQPSESDWWDRLSKIADGSEQAKPNEIKDMLRNLVGRTEVKSVPSLDAKLSPADSKRAFTAHSTIQAQVSPKYSPAYGVPPTISQEPKALLVSRSDRNNNGTPLAKPAQSLRSRANSPPPPPPPLPAHTPAESTIIDLSPHEVFAREALALQEELAGMQKTLEERMLRYQKLVSSGLPNK
jgi:hypothetical protein